MLGFKAPLSPRAPNPPSPEQATRPPLQFQDQGTCAALAPFAMHDWLLLQIVFRGRWSRVRQAWVASVLRTTNCPPGRRADPDPL